MTRTRIGILRVAAWSVPLIVGALLTTSPANADLSGVGGSLGYATPENLDGTAALGLHAEITRPGSHLQMIPNMRFWDVDGTRDVTPNLDLAYRFQNDQDWTPYVGGGLGINFVHQDRFDRTNTDLGVNVIGGVRFPGDRNHYFLEGRYTASDLNQVSVQTGITFGAP